MKSASLLLIPGLRFSLPSLAGPCRLRLLLLRLILFFPLSSEMAPAQIQEGKEETGGAWALLLLALFFKPPLKVSSSRSFSPASASAASVPAASASCGSRSGWLQPGPQDLRRGSCQGPLSGRVFSHENVQKILV